MITHQPVNNHDDMRNVADNILREVGLSLGEEHQIVKPNLITGMTAFGELTKAGSQVEGMKTPQYWDDPLLYMPGSSKLEWLPR
jgi:hypothetical protein